MNVELYQTAMNLLQSRFDIKFAMNCRDFDLDPELLIRMLRPYQNQHFGVNEKILLVHMDTDYYDPLLPCGLIPINVVRIFKQLDISFSKLLFVTNHFGISREFDQLLSDQHPNDRPILIETLLSRTLLPNLCKNLDTISFDQIEKSAVCMMSTQRSHRLAFYNFLINNNLSDKVAISQNFNA
jgi:hypothetical protein